jgi:hypothetical protein
MRDDATDDRQRLNPMAIPVRDAAKLLSKAGGQAIDEETLLLDIEDGAPTNADSTLNLVHYAAWLVKEMGRGD